MSVELRIAIVNDLPIALEAIRRVVLGQPGHRVAWVATDGAQAIARCRDDRPDVVLMDMVMPAMDGVEATRRIMRDTPCPILVVTASVEGNASRVYDALGAGALDAVSTPTIGVGGEVGGGAVLLRKLRHILLLREERTGEAPAPTPVRVGPEARPATGDLLAIGASTGGPKALSSLLAALSRPVRVPILVVQHLGAEYVPGLASWLSNSSGLPTVLVDGPTLLAPGTVHLSAGEGHLVAGAPGSVTVAREPADALHRPSVDVLFSSLRQVGASGVAILLTGMGSDGARGLLELRSAGWSTIAQDQNSSTVWGMPGEAVRIGAASEVLGIDDMAWAVGRALAGRSAQRARMAGASTGAGGAR